MQSSNDRRFHGCKDARRHGGARRSNPNPSFIAGAGSACGVAVDGLSPSDEGDLPSNEGDLPSNKFSFGKLKRNKKKGTAKLTVTVPGPGGLQLNKRKKLRAAQKNAPEAGKVKLPIKPRPKGKKRLNKHGNTTVTAKVTFTPEGGEPKTKLKRLKLKKRS